jgi:hypothetical protein
MKYTALRIFTYSVQCLVLFVASPTLVVAAPPFSDSLGKGYAVTSFEIVCDSARYPITQHFKYEDGVYSEFTVTKGNKRLLFSARPSKIEYAEKRNTFESSPPVEWREIAIGIRDSSNILSVPESEAVDLKTIVISTDNNPGHNTWSVVKIEEQDVYLTDDGYLSSAFTSNDVKERCSMENLITEQ